jgi:peptide/nickel transport system substrate-binding protein
MLLGVVFFTVPATAETPKSGGTLTYMIAANAPPSFDAHREGTFATVHSAAPFYSVLIRVDPNNPSSTTDSAANSTTSRKSICTIGCCTRPTSPGSGP